MKGTSLATMAWRNLWRNRRRTVITLTSISFGMLLSVIFTGMGDATYSKMIDLAAKTGGGHVTLQHPDFLRLPSPKRTIAQTGEKSRLALKDKVVTRTVTRISGYTMLATSSNSLGAFFIAFDPKAEDVSTLSVLQGLKQGELFKSAKDKGIVVGERLAQNLDVGLGRKVVYTMTDKNGEIVTGLARVSGIIRTGSPGVDRGLCLLPIDTMREVLGYAKDEATLIGVFVGDQRKAGEVASRLEKTIGKETAVLTWRQTKPDLAGFVSLKVNATRFFEILIMILVAAGIFNTLFMSVMERIREFGIMMAIGFSPGRLFGLVMWESLWLALTGIIAGAVVTALPYYYLNKNGMDMSMMVKKGVDIAGVGVDPVMYVGIYPENAVLITAVVLVATLVSGLYPAWKAGRVVPVESIKLV